VNEYRVVIAGLFDGQAIEEVPPETLRYTDALDDGGAATFDVQKQNPKCTRALLEPFQRQVLVQKGDDLKWRGILGPASMSSDADVVSFGAIGYFTRLMDRYVDADQVFTAEDELDIAWDLIDFTQAKTLGDLGITRWGDETLSTILRTLTYLGADRPSIGQIIRDLAAADDGFDFEITPDLVWKAYHPSKGVVTNAVFELGKNIRSYQYGIDPMSIATDLTASGSGSGATKVTSVVFDATARAAYGRIEASISFSDVDDQDLLDALAAQELLNRAKPDEQPAIVLKVDVDSSDTAFTVGDQVKVRIQDGYLDVDDFFRVLAKTVSIDDDGQETVSALFEAKVV
jgi:hypothetical protein